MVRKKTKKAPEATEHLKVEINTVVFLWLEDLQLLGHEVIPAVPPDLDVFNLRETTLSMPSDQSSKATAFAQVRGMQALRASVVRGTFSLQELRLIFLCSLLLFIDPATSFLRKSLKSLMAVAESACKERGDSTDAMVDLVAARFVERAWGTMSLGLTPVSPSATRASSPEASTATTATTASALRIVASLQWLLEVPAGKHALLGAGKGSIFSRSITLLGLILDVQAPAIKMCGRRGVLGSWQPSEAAALLNPGATAAAGTTAVTSPTSVRAATVTTREDKEREGVAEARLSTAIDYCSEVLKAAASLMASTK